MRSPSGPASSDLTPSPSSINTSPSRRHYDVVDGHAPTPGSTPVRPPQDPPVDPPPPEPPPLRPSPSPTEPVFLVRVKETDEYLEVDFTEAIALLGQTTNDDDVKIIGVLTPDSGASKIFVWADCPWILPNSRCRLPKPLRVLQGTTAAIATHGALMMVVASDARHRGTGNVLVLPCIPIPNFRQGLALVGTGVLRQFHVHILDPSDPDPPYLVRTSPTDTVWHFNYNDYAQENPVVALARTPSNLLAIPLRHHSNFTTLHSLVTNSSFDLAHDLDALRARLPDMNDLRFDDVPRSPLSAYVTASSSTSQRRRLAILCAGVCSERVFADESWFCDFEVVLIAERRPELAALARTRFPNAVIVNDVRKIPALVKSGELNVKAECGMVSFDCQSESKLKDLNHYDDWESAPDFRGPLRFKIMDALNMTHLLEENVPPNSKTAAHFTEIRRLAPKYGYHTQIDICDAAYMGARTSRLRAILKTTRNDQPLCDWNVAALSGLSSVPAHPRHPGTGRQRFL